MINYSSNTRRIRKSGVRLMKKLFKFLEVVVVLFACLIVIDHYNDNISIVSNLDKIPTMIKSNISSFITNDNSQPAKQEPYEMQVINFTKKYNVPSTLGKSVGDALSYIDGYYQTKNTIISSIKSWELNDEVVGFSLFGGEYYYYDAVIDGNKTGLPMMNGSNKTWTFTVNNYRVVKITQGVLTIYTTENGRPEIYPY